MHNSFDPLIGRMRLRKILILCTKIDNCDDDWIDALEFNILEEFDRR